MEPRRRKLLIVDDDEGVHKALRLTLRREPYELLHAYDAAEAWAVLAEHPDVEGVVCDHNMPGMRGVRLLSCIHEQRPHLPTVLLTAEATVELACEAVNGGGVKGILTKPWVPEELRARLRTLLHADPTTSEDQQCAAERIEAELKRELTPARDPETGAFIIDESTL